KRLVSFNVAHLANATASRWNFLHDGTSDWTYFFVGRFPGALADEKLFDTNAGSAGNRGVGLYFDRTVTGGMTHHVVSESALLQRLFPGRRSRKGVGITGSAPVIICYRLQASSGRLTCWVQGIKQNTDGKVGSYATGDANRGLRVGYTSTVDIARHFMTKSALTDAQVNRVTDWLATNYGITITRPTGHTQIIYSGNSLICPEAPSAANPNFPDNVKALLANGTNVYERINGISGQTTQQMTTRDPNRIDAFRDTTAARTIVVGLEGINDIANGSSAADAVTHMQAWVAARYAAGWHRVVLVSMTPCKSKVSEANRTIYNNALVAGEGVWFDALADVHTDTTIGEANDEDNATYYQDGVHPTAAGNDILATYVASAIDTAMG
ncbi:MAG TPA: SGNH/GDSL hydrolase family protein, partial [Vicinamibacterales bacterium]|nr:SGNH/GDSL hydrolase family protein [Vicinamibacterales bacterium]